MIAPHLEDELTMFSQLYPATPASPAQPQTTALASEDTLSGVNFGDLIGQQLTPSGTATAAANDKPTWVNFFTWLLDPIEVRNKRNLELA